MRHSFLPSHCTTTVKLPSRIKIGMAVILATSSFVSACASRERAKVPAAAPPPSAAAPPSQQPSQTSPPRLDEVQQAVARVFKGAVLVDSTRNPNFLAGDFNGDGSQD